MSRAIVVQQKTGLPVQFEITPQTREAVLKWIMYRDLRPADYLFPSRVKPGSHLSRRQYARLFTGWVTDIGLDPSVRYLGIEVDDALELAEQTEV